MKITQICDECAEYINKNTWKIVETGKPTKGICPICNGRNSTYRIDLNLNGEILYKVVHRDLTTKERLDLSLELRCCYYLHSWNISAEIKQTQDWVNRFWEKYLPEDYPVKTQEKRGRNGCRQEVNKLIEFAKLIYEKGHLEGEDAHQKRLCKVISKMGYSGSR